MEVGPLNKISPPVKGPTEGQPGRANQITPQGNRLIGEGVKASPKAVDSADIATREVNSDELQMKIALASTAQKAILRLIETIHDTGKGIKDANAANRDIDKITSQEFNGQPLFNGGKLVLDKTDGSRVEAMLPDKAQIIKSASAALKSLDSTKDQESQAYKQINELYKQLSDFTANAKNELKNILGATNKRASSATVNDIARARQMVEQIAKSKPETITYAKPYGDLAAKAVKLLK